MARRASAVLYHVQLFTATTFESQLQLCVSLLTARSLRFLKRAEYLFVAHPVVRSANSTLYRSLEHLPSHTITTRVSNGPPTAGMFCVYDCHFSQKRSLCVSSPLRALVVGSKDTNTRVYAASQLTNLRVVSLGGFNDSVVACFFEQNSLDVRLI